MHLASMQLSYRCYKERGISLRKLCEEMRMILWGCLDIKIKFWWFFWKQVRKLIQVLPMSNAVWGM
jgi:hypothetical protein